jgi:hypothetical protein
MGALEASTMTNHAKDCRCITCLVDYKDEQCEAGWLCVARKGHDGPCTGVLTHVRLLATSARILTKHWLRKVSQ